MGTADSTRGDRIRQLRENRHRSQRAVAEAVGVSERAYQNWEAGGNIAWPNAVALARVLESTPDFILDGVTNEDGSPPVAADSTEDVARRVRALEAQAATAGQVARLLADHDARMSELDQFIRSSWDALARRITQLEDASGELADLPDVARSLVDQMQELTLAVQELRTGAGALPRPEADEPPSAATRAT